MKLKVFINKKAGSVETYGIEALRQACHGAFGLEDDIKFLQPDEFSKHLEEVSDGETVLIGGGDGTILNAASILAPKSIPFGVLPLGTMNMFAKDLGLQPNPLVVIERYSKQKIVDVDAASVNGKIFLCSAMVGLPTHLARYRESQRSKETPLTWLTLAREGWYRFTHRRGRNMRLSGQGLSETKSIKAAVISNNQYSQNSGLSFKKASLTDGELSVYMLNPEGSLESLMLMAQLAVGSWDSASGLEAFNTPALQLDMKRRKVSVLLDGEIYKLSGPLLFKSEPRYLRILLPDE